MHTKIKITQGALLVSLGAPENANERSVRRYLADYLKDRRIVNITPWLWLPFLHLFILPFRLKHLVKNYAAIEKNGEMPSRTHGHALAQGTQKKLEHAGHSIRVLSAMTYGNPSIEAGLAVLKSEGIEHALIIPLFIINYIFVESIISVSLKIASLVYFPSLKIPLFILPLYTPSIP